MSSIINFKVKLFFSLFLLIFLFGCSSENNPPPAASNANTETVQENQTKSKKPEEELNIFYLGYGSNMNLGIMKGRCGDQNLMDLGRASLPGYRLYFFDRGYANIRRDKSSQVEGVLYKINERCLKSLDRAEGYPTFYNRHLVSASYQGKLAEAIVYEVMNDQTIGTPSDDYYRIVLSGAIEHNLPQSYIDYINEIAGKSALNP